MPGSDAGAIPGLTAHGPSYLMVSDGAAAKVYFYRVPGMTLTGTLSGVKLGSSGPAPSGVDPAANTPMHGGAIVLPDGRILVNDESQQRTMAIKLDAAGVPSIVNSVRSRLATEAPWTAVDPLFRYYAVASNGGGPSPGTEILNLIDLRTFKNTQLEIPLKGETEDLTPFFGGNPLTLFAGVGGNEMRAYNVATLLRGNATPTGTFLIGPNSHGGFSSPVTGTIGITTGPQPPNLGEGEPDTESRQPGHGRVRRGLWSHPMQVTFQHCAPVCSHAVHVAGKPRHGALGCGWPHARQGQPGSRGFPVSRTYAVEPIVRPKVAGAKDQLKIIDVRPKSPAYLQIVRTVDLEQMTKGPVDGVAPTYPAYERRFAAITPDGRYAFVTRGGDGKIDMVNTATGAVTAITAPSSLTGGGHITAFQVGAIPWDLSGR